MSEKVSWSANKTLPDPFAPRQISVDGHEEKGELDTELKPNQGNKPDRIIFHQLVSVDCNMPFEHGRCE